MGVGVCEGWGVLESVESGIADDVASGVPVVTCVGVGRGEGVGISEGGTVCPISAWESNIPLSKTSFGVP